MVISQSAFILWRPGKDNKIHWLGYEWAENGDCWFDSKDFKDVKIFLDKNEAEEEIDAYVEKIRTNMKQLLKGCDGIKLN